MHNYCECMEIRYVSKIYFFKKITRDGLQI
jgi:hypothetical protein